MNSIEKLIAKLEQAACHCDVIMGWTCSIHTTVDELRTAIARESAAPAAPKCTCLERTDGIGPMNDVHDSQCPAARSSERNAPADVHGPAGQAIVEKWLLAYQHGEAKEGDCKGIMENIKRESWDAARREALEEAVELLRLARSNRTGVATA